MTNIDEQLASDINTDELSKTFIDIAEKSQLIVNKFLHHHHNHADYTMAQMLHLGELYKEFFHKLMVNPTQVARAQLSYWRDYMTLWQFSLQRWLGNSDSNVTPTQHKDKRFQDNAWNEHPYFNFVKHFYLLTAKHIQEVISKVEGLDKKAHQQLNFYTQQFIDAIAPSNFIVTNPEVLQTTLQKGGKNLLQGLNNMLADLERSKNNLLIKMTDLNAFEIGKNIACTPGKIIYQNDLMQLIQYQPQTTKVYRRPLLMITAWINKYYVLDLSEENSMVRWLVAQGYTVFMISWVNPDSRHAHKEFQDYMLEGPLAALDVIEKATGEHQVNALGFCLGGTLLACTLAYLAAKKEERILSATYLGTLLDFTEPGDMAALIDDNQIRLLEHEMDKKGYLDGGRMSMTFNMLRANDLIWSYFIKNYLQGEEPFPFDFLYWNADATNMPAKMHSFYLRGMYLHNLLLHPESIKLGGVPIDLNQIKIPVYLLATHFDHIAPWKASYAGIKLHSGPVEFVLGGSGHIAGVVNHPNANKYSYYVNANKPDQADDWLKEATEYPGTWWIHWENWLRKYSGKKVDAREPGQGVIPVIENSPGSYVQVSLLKTNANSAVENKVTVD